MPDKLPKGAIGYRDDFSEDELAGKHIDGVTGLVFEDEDGYLNHTSPVSGHKPTEIEHLVKTTTPEMQAIADAAAARGEDRKGEKVHPAKLAEREAKK